MKKALLLVLVLAFMLVPVFSSAVSADSADAWIIGPGYNVDGTMVPAELEATEAGLVFTQEKGYFGPAFDAFGWGINFADGQGDGIGVVAKEGFDPLDAQEISVTFSLDEFNRLFTEKATGNELQADAWFKWTLMNRQSGINFEGYADGLQGICISASQDYYDWGQEKKRIRIWFEYLKAVDNDGDGTFDGMSFTTVNSAEWGDGYTDGIWLGEYLGQDITISLIWNANTNRYLLKASVAGEEQILAAGVKLMDLWGWDCEAVYMGFASANENTRIALRKAQALFEEDCVNPQWKDAIYDEAGELVTDLAAYQGDNNANGIESFVMDGSDIVVNKNDEGKVTHLKCNFIKKAGDHVVEEWWRTTWPDELAYENSVA
jgi:hypothetical protein